jgi:hypothetical protein
VEGRVVDFDGRPLSGAKITGSIVVRKFFQAPPVGLFQTMYGTTHSFSVMTDAEGRFKFSSPRAYSLDVSDVQKDGFVQAYWIEVPADQASRRVHSARREGEPRTYVMLAKDFDNGNHLGHVSFDMRINGGARDIDLLHATAPTAGKEGSGQLRVTVTGEPINRQTSFRFAWAATIAGRDAELLQTQDSAPGQVPDDGFVTHYDYEFVPKPEFRNSPGQPDPGWAGNLNRYFYIRGRDGRFFAWCRVSIEPQYSSYRGDDEARVAIEYVYNQNGSENIYTPWFRK